ncbi:Cys-tRNA(Pro) deacylase [Pectinatus sottacetonis]|uniref:Cys-tRNA(Pro) deacylase n=1 Tax=Pectinatus sottacetonis TaxID=1002795 RepID=UPI0018C454FD|nr:Cys-tRNA(Pro) deacylase [Pectinatus sottacetonis]
MKKTNAARILDGLDISYEIKGYPVDLSDLSAVHVAAETGMNIKTIFKTLVVRGDKTGILMGCIPGDDELDMKKLAAISTNKKVEMVHLKDVQALTGYVRGGCSPLGTKKKYPVFIDQSALKWTQIAVSAGKRGEQLLLSPADLIKAVAATPADIIKVHNS